MATSYKSEIPDMVKTAFCILCLIFLCQCSSRSIGIGRSDIVKVELMYKIPALYTDDSAFVAIDSTCIYYYQQYRVYELPSRYQEYVNGELKLDTPTIYYVGYDTIRKKAYKTSSLVDSPLTEIRVDSFLAGRPESFNVNKVLAAAVFEKNVSFSKGKMASYYTFKDGAMDSLVLFFDKSLTDMPFSYAPDLDAVNKSKLVRIQFNLKPDSSKNAIQLNQYRIVSWEMRRVETDKNFPTITIFCKKMENAYHRKGM